MLYFLLQIFVIKGQNCPVYTCKLSSQSFSGSTCIAYLSNTYYVSPCAAGTCAPSLGSGNSTCSSSMPVALRTAFPGEKCSSNFNCSSSICANSICQGSPINASCLINTNCSAGNICLNSICSAQVGIGKNPCFSDYDCVNNAGCNNLVCVAYFSLNPGQVVSTCSSSHINFLCKSGMCGQKGLNWVCLDTVQNSAPSPYTCTVGNLCVSKIQQYADSPLTTECQCGLGNGYAHCGLFFGDKFASNFLALLKKWTGSKLILNCNSDVRFDSLCLQTWLSAQEYAQYNYYYLMTYYYPYLVNAQDCVLQVYVPAFYQVKTQMANASFLAIFGIIGLII